MSVNDQYFSAVTAVGQIVLPENSSANINIERPEHCMLWLSECRANIQTNTFYKQKDSMQNQMLKIRFTMV